MEATTQPFAIKPVLTGMLVFIAVETMLVGLVGNIVIGFLLSLKLTDSMQGLLALLSYLLSGLLISTRLPELRLRESAVAALLVIIYMLLLTYFTPYSYILTDPSDLPIGSAAVFVTALAGLKLGQKITSNHPH